MQSRFLTIFALSAALALSVRAEDKPKDPAAAAFPGLATVAIPEKDTPFPGQVAYDAKLSELIDKPLPLEEGAPEIRRMISTRVSRDAETRYFIDFDPGPSADPGFDITDQKTGKLIGSIGAESLAIPGNGFIYATGRANRMHLEHLKYAIRDGKLVEIEQPFSYVGLQSKAKVELKLLAKKDGGETIATIPKGDSLEVVLRDGEHLLIKTRFGLLGWWKMNTSVMANNAEIEGIYYAGD
ncbi:hypothetical protein [Haloferula sp. BvORR071]|uniref:hypothetical protein n=1 Tax=Haloferula sp. BvORR071 TaxID=1396141 RepID=UPI0005575C5A|nr:hypothetical protein [Haloferula sp. BvORR071]